VVFKSNEGEPPANRGIRGHLYIPVRGRRFIEIDTQKLMCVPMYYPLLFPNGDGGWQTRMPYTTTSRRERDEAPVMAMIVDEDEEEQIDPLWPMLTVFIRNEIAAADGNQEIDNEQVKEREAIEEQNDEQQQEPNTN